MKTLLATALLLASVSANAHEVSVADALELPVTQNMILHSQAGEGLTAFVKRIAPDMAALTESTGHEVCGVVAVTTTENDGTKPGAFSIMVGGIGSQIACFNAEIETGYTSLGRTIHTHPVKKTVRLTAIDMKARGTPAGQLRRENLNNCEFSSQDYATPGYLITCGKVLTQSGAGTSKEL